MVGTVSGHMAHAKTFKFPFLKFPGLTPEPQVVFRWEFCLFHLHLSMSMGEGSPGQLTPGFHSA